MKGNTKARRDNHRFTGRKINRLAARLAAHNEWPVAADGSQWGSNKPKAKRPGSLNPRKH